MMASRLLVIGWDGATFDLVEPWIAAGELPNLARLMRDGVHGRLRSVPNMNSGPAWTSVSTGLNPGKHGIYGLTDFAAGSYRVRPLNGSDRHGKVIWRQLSEGGRQVVVMNLPITYPAEPVNGVLVAGGDAPSSRSPQFTHPEGLIDEINAEAGEYILAARLDGLIRAGRKAAALDRLHRMIEGRTRAALYLMERQPWDLFLVLFTASDSVQHYFWEDLAGGPYQDAILGVFRRLDETLGALLAQAGDHTTTIVLSDHGFGPTRPGLRYLNDFLAGLGLLCYKPRRDSRTTLLRWAFLQLEKRLGDGTKEWLLEHFPRLHESATAGLWVDGVDWSSTRAFNLAGSSQIWVNLRDRQPEGIVSPGEEYEEVVSLIQQALGEAVDPVTRRPAVKAVHWRADLYHGPFLDRAPDLLVEWTEESDLSGLAWYGDVQQVMATRSIAHRRHPVNGGHREMGILVASGPPFKKGELIDGATLHDIAPTLLCLLNQPIPTSLDGQPLTAALADHWLQAHAPQFVEERQDSTSASGISASAADEDEVMGRLRALGYVE
ncbi:MAG: alkaline phosphatase family protein [Chloroflexi bacterium]|nr:alkaline phosphatase family protein [Chloroflexota bacterium]